MSIHQWAESESMIVLRATVYAALLIVLSRDVSSSENGEIMFKGLNRHTAACLQKRCSKQIESCVKHHRDHDQAKLKGCIVKKCKSIGMVCIEEMISEITPYLLQNENSRMFILILGYAMDQYMECWITNDEIYGKNFTGCLMRGVFNKTKVAYQHVFHMKESVRCWVNTVMDGGVDCIEEIDDRDLEKFGLLWSEKIENMFPEYIICSRLGFFSGRPSCLKIAEEVFGNAELWKAMSGYISCLVRKVLPAIRDC
ncbi:uncharacterized protein LOC117404294 isoform X1 [Acipenser ruthenus]|uniref:uncharacterized protein LOC117404294 isoform X1 n=2 Tax=Acipenser ruthenus TaxID=7906 RepID=UPI002741B804|nr:uncharacterized protein LOC117404294 isoform X1 [Acipenser ruthenus]